MRALLILLLAFAAGPALARQASVPETPVVTAPLAAAPAPAVPVVQASPADPGVMSATDAVDPLADLIAKSGPQTTDEEGPAADAPLPPHKPTILPIPPPEPPAGPSASGTPSGGAMPLAEVYDLRIKSSIVAAQGLQGPLDGGWSVSGPDGTALYALQIADPVGGEAPPEGAWRDPRRNGAVGATGLIDAIDRAGEGFQARFSPRAGQSAVLSLSPRGDGTWTGRLSDGGVETAVVARRVAQAVLPPGYAAQGRGPVVWPRPAAPRLVAAAPAKTPACATRGKKGKALKAAKARCAAAVRKGGKGKGAAVKGKRGAKGKETARGGKASKRKKRR
ncbi:hypothetical protein [Caulobacter sp. LARHSG274]